MIKATGHKKDGFCHVYYDGNYPVPFDGKLNKDIMEKCRTKKESLGALIAREQSEPRFL